LECDILFKNPSEEDDYTFYLTKLTDRRTNKSWKEWLDEGELDNCFKQKIDVESFNKIFRQEKLERVLKEEDDN
jgi:hypothetical protein